MEFFRAVESNRVYIFTAENGGLEKDGMILIRPGVEDVSIGDRTYAPVRIAVDFEYQLRGMAVYSSDIPDGFDIAVYTRHSIWNLMRNTYNKQFSTILPIKNISDPFDHEVVEIPGSKVYLYKTDCEDWNPFYRSYTEEEIKHMIKIADELLDGKLSVDEAQEKLECVHKEFGNE